MKFGLAGSGPRARALRSIARDGRGNFAVMFALSAPVLIVLLGLGLDYLSGLSFKTRWDTAADAAALAAVQAAEAYVKANAATVAEPALVTNAEAAGVAAGRKAFHANAGASAATESVTPTVAMSQSGTQFTATATYAGAMGTHFGGLVGISSLAISGASVATASMTTYINYYIIVDISQSMGFGSTQTDMSNLYSLTLSMGYFDNNEPGCVFGCHTATYGRPLTNEQVAHNNGITLRIDAARTAMQDVISQASALSTVGNIQIGLYTMQLNPITNSYRTVTLSSSTSNYAKLTTANNKMDLGPNTSVGLADTDLADSLQDFGANIVPANGTGFSPSSPLNYVFVVTDGLVDKTGMLCLYNHCTGVIPNSTCSQLQQNSTVGVIYTTYLPIYKQNNSALGYDADYIAFVLPYQSAIRPSLLSCASSANYFFQADDGPALIAAMQALFASTSAPVTITQ